MGVRVWVWVRARARVRARRQSIGDSPQRPNGESNGCRPRAEALPQAVRRGRQCTPGQRRHPQPSPPAQGQTKRCTKGHTTPQVCPPEHPRPRLRRPVACHTPRQPCTHWTPQDRAANHRRACLDEGGETDDRAGLWMRATATARMMRARAWLRELNGWGPQLGGELRLWVVGLGCGLGLWPPHGLPLWRIFLIAWGVPFLSAVTRRDCRTSASPHVLAILGW